MSLYRLIKLRSLLNMSSDRLYYYLVDDLLESSGKNCYSPISIVTSLRMPTLLESDILMFMPH
jgi:hypothetical protein